MRISLQHTARGCSKRARFMRYNITACREETSTSRSVRFTSPSLTGCVPCIFRVLSMNLGSVRYWRAVSPPCLYKPSNWSRAHCKINMNELNPQVPLWLQSVWYFLFHQTLRRIQNFDQWTRFFYVDVPQRYCVLRSPYMIVNSSHYAGFHLIRLHKATLSNNSSEKLRLNK